MDKHLNEEALSAEIMSYVKNRIYNYAVLIDGDWGTGKTYFIQKSLIPKLEQSGYMPIYISLYGINSTDSVSQKIALSILINKLPDHKKALAQKCIPIVIVVCTKLWYKPLLNPSINLFFYQHLTLFPFFPLPNLPLYPIDRGSRYFPVEANPFKQIFALAILS